MIKYLLDTNIVIYTIKNKPEKVRKIFNEHEGQMAISSVTYMELVYGYEKSKNPVRNMEVVQGFVSRLSLLDYDSFAAQHTGQIRCELSKKGSPIGPYDQMIAGHARAHALTLVTNNIKEFSRVIGLRIENWTETNFS